MRTKDQSTASAHAELSPREQRARDDQRLAQARQHRGQSLSQDAWRRLRRNRGAFWALVFLALFALASFTAPLLPLASPTALMLESEPQPPPWPLGANPRLSETAQARAGFGAGATRGYRALADDGWQHRTFVDVELTMPLGTLEPRPDEAIAALVARVASREPRVFVRAGDTPGKFVQRHALPQWSDDRARTDWMPTGRRAAIEAALVLAEGTALANVSLAAPHAGGLIQSVEARPYPGGLEVVATFAGSANAELDAVPRRYRLPWRAAGSAEVMAIDVDGVRLASGAVRGPDGEWPALAAELALEPALEMRFAGRTLAFEGPLTHFEARGPNGAAATLERRRAVVDELSPVAAHDLGARVARALATEGRGKLAALAHTDGIWDLGAFDTTLLNLRGRIFGLWQSGPLLGTDAKGRDLLARIVWGSRISIQVSLVATLCSLAIGVTWGALAGLLGGRVDNTMMRIVDILYSVPFIFIVIFLITLLNEYRTELADHGIGYMTIFYLVIGAIYWLTMARVVRGQVLALKNQEFVEAARTLGASTPRILFAHLVPNVLSIVIVYLTLTIPAVMLFEAFLSFLGLGVEPPRVSWGLLAVDATDSISAVVVYWWAIVFPSLAMGSALLALNVLGDGLRDALDPKLRGKD